ncbi:MAG: type II toxin-antitoxin system VapC family toxin [Gammaproteobacteria bacterium]|nr:type II toxin-antitoxin system VapC family toxin [Gammaproteobacteria bacterium]
MALVVDASVAVRWYMAGSKGEAARRLLQQDASFIAPDLILPEVGNSIWMMQRAGKISVEHGSQIVASLPSAFDRLFSGKTVGERALAIATALDHPVYDCYYLALAEREDTKMISADKRLLKRVADSDWKQLLQPLPFDG